MVGMWSRPFALQRRRFFSFFFLRLRWEMCKKVHHGEEEKEKST